MIFHIFIKSWIYEMLEFSDVSRIDRANLAEMFSGGFLGETQKAPKAKTEFVLNKNIAGFIEHFGIERCGFLTLTFADDVQDVREASRRFNSMRTNFLCNHILGYIGVYERTKRGVIHFHFVVALKTDIRKGFNFEAMKKANRGALGLKLTTNPELKALWVLLKDTLPKYGFGHIHQLVPVKSEQGISHYISKYLSKGVFFRLPQDKGCRFVRSSSDKGLWWKRATSRFAWHSPAAIRWRNALKQWVNDKSELFQAAYFDLQGIVVEIDESNYSKVLQTISGDKWCYFHRHTIIYHYEKQGFI